MSFRISDNFVDPISEEPLTEPVIDPCGHYFNKSTIEKLRNQHGKIFSCPISRNPIDSSELKEMKQMGRSISQIVECEEIEETEKIEKNTKIEEDAGTEKPQGKDDLTQSLLKKIEVLISMNVNLSTDNACMYRKMSDMSSSMADLINRVDGLQRKNDASEIKIDNMQKQNDNIQRQNDNLQRQNDNLQRQNNVMTSEMSLMNKKLTHVCNQNIILNKKINNASNMTIWDHTVAIFSSKKMRKVMNKGVSTGDRLILAKSLDSIGNDVKS